MNFRKILLFAAAFIGLILFQREVVLPFVLDVVKSDLFLTDSDDLGDRHVISNNMTNFANMHCTRYIADDFDQAVQFTFLEKPLNAWNMGNNTYIINSELEFTDTEGQHLVKKFVCRIRFDASSGPDGAPDYDNWSVYGISGLDGI